MTLTKLPIVEVDFGIANRFDDHIEINRNLKKYPHLLEPILEHEFSHTDKSISIEDFKLDFIQSSNINSFEMLKFMVKHPKSFTQILPFYWTRKNGFVYDFNLGVMYLIMISIFIITIYLGGKYL